MTYIDYMRAQKRYEPKGSVFNYKMSALDDESISDLEEHETDCEPAEQDPRLESGITMKQVQ